MPSPLTSWSFEPGLIAALVALVWIYLRGRRDLAVDLREYPILSWRWKVDNLIAKSDPTAKAGDDYAARIYIAFRYEPERVPLLRKAKFKAAQLVFGDLPIGAINYIWATATPVGSILDNPFAGDFVKMIPVRSGAGELGRWVEERRNVAHVAALPPRRRQPGRGDLRGERAAGLLGDVDERDARGLPGERLDDGRADAAAPAGDEHAAAGEAGVDRGIDKRLQDPLRHAAHSPQWIRVIPVLFTSAAVPNEIVPQLFHPRELIALPYESAPRSARKLQVIR